LKLQGEFQHFFAVVAVPAFLIMLPHSAATAMELAAMKKLKI
jgi:hypothetical protein